MDSEKRYMWYLIFVSFVLVGAKMFIAYDVPVSALFSDDLNALNRAIYYAEGEVRMKAGGYPWKELNAGFLYFWLITPWILFSSATRLFFVFFVNAICSAVFVYFGSRTVEKLSTKRSLLIPICLATLASPFQFTYYVMTENLLFALLGLLAYLVVDFRETINSRTKFAALLLVLAALPATRAPGFAAVIAVLWLFVRNSASLGRFRSFGLGLICAVTATIPYLWHSSFFKGERTGHYLASITQVLHSPERIEFIIRMLVSQIGYLLIASGAWCVPIIFIAYLQSRKGYGENNRKMRDFLEFVIVGAGLFIALCIVHLVYKFFDLAKAKGGETNVPEWFIYGRYDDPALLLIVIGALAGLFMITKMSKGQKFFYHLLLPTATVVAFYFIAEHKYVPINQAGLSIFASNRSGLSFSIIIICILVYLSFMQLRPLGKNVITFLLLALLSFNVLSVTNGMSYTVHRANKASRPLVAAKWLTAYTPKNVVLGFDKTVANQPAPLGIKNINNVYMAMVFETYPRPFVMIEGQSKLTECDYLFTLETSILIQSLDTAWTDGTYGLYHCAKK